MIARKWIGFLLLCVGGAVMGLRAKRAVAMRVHALRALAESFGQMRAAIAFGKVPFPQIVDRLAGEERPSAVFFAAVGRALRQQTAAEAAWRTACDQCAERLCLRSAEAAELRAIGQSLAALNSEAAVQALEVSAQAFGRWAESAEAARHDEERLKLTLWLTAAVLAGILLL